LNQAPQGFSGRCCGAAFSGDGKLLVVSFMSGIVAVWDLQHRTAVFSRSVEGKIPSVAFSPDPKNYCIAFPAGTTVTPERWNREAQCKAATWELVGAGSKVTRVTFSPTASVLAGSSEDGRVLFWDLDRPRQKPDPFVAHDGPVTSVEFSPDGARLISAGH